MPIQGSSTSIPLSGFDHLAPHEELLLEQLCDPLPECPDCGCPGLFLASWTPWRTVKRIVCGICFRTAWESPERTR